MINKYISIFIITLCCVACEPQEDAKPDIGAVPNPSFEITQGNTPNEFILTNTTPDVFLTSWDLGTAGQLEGAVVTATFSFMGTYDVKMTTFNQGGSASATQSVNVTQDDPNACFGNFQILTNCVGKTWKLAPEAGALLVAPSDYSTVWWENTESDVTERSCHFDDEYIFRQDGTFEYDNKGDFWADSDDGGVYPPDMGISVGCHPSSDWPSKYQAWDSGMHNFSVTENTLTVIGEGAWIGLYKVGTSSDVLKPQQSVTYNIQSIDANRIVLVADYGSQIWKFTLAAQ